MPKSAGGGGRSGRAGGGGGRSGRGGGSASRVASRVSAYGGPSRATMARRQRAIVGIDREMKAVQGRMKRNEVTAGVGRYQQWQLGRQKSAIQSMVNDGKVWRAHKKYVGGPSNETGRRVSERRADKVDSARTNLITATKAIKRFGSSR